MEGLRLRVKDVDFAENQITVRDGKGAKDRVTMLPQSIQDELRRHLREVERLHKKDLREGFGKEREETMIYTHVLNRGGRGVQSPLDLL